ncbi:conserved fungal protein [Aspergillus terreus]|uniref:Conserved fungal protein n=1 Tax=Aspergillus terreus TaxID=33178 RepID=A0A5M3Z2H6_ASPTE|nr:hypothetical protein ATETN484_0007028800 [Aspergillus terreus]GFF16093.1 conserved fungal protein [Aspergillus terreus]
MSNLAPSDVASSATSDTSLEFILHVLCPSLPPPNRFTFRDLTASHTLADLKARISQILPNRPSPELQRLIYCGKPLLDDSVSLQRVLGPVNGAEYSMHLVLPPKPPSLSQTASTSPASAPPRSPAGISAYQSPFIHSRSVPPSSMPNDGQGLRYRGPTTPTVPSEAEIGLALRRNIEAIRQQIEQRERDASSLQGQHSNATSLSNPLTSPQPAAWPRTSQSLSQPPTTATTPQFSHLPSLGLPEDPQQSLRIIRPQIALCEEQLNRGIAPPMDQIIWLRSQLFALLDEQYRNPHAERDGSIESLLSRVFNLYTRADQMRVTQCRTAPANRPIDGLAASAANVQAQAPLYLLTSPTGYQALIAPQRQETIHTTLEALRAAHDAQTAPFAGAANPNAQNNTQPNVMENAVRRAAVNYPRQFPFPRPVRDNDNMLARNVRRVWLFVRLYFFCYMFSEPGTWSRVLYVAFAVLVSLLSETMAPQVLYNLFFLPVQRHLEGLVHNLPHERADGGDPAVPANEPAQPPPGGASLMTEMRRNLRRVERSFALFIASLVPGLGERHIAVRDAAEELRNEARRQEAQRNEERAQAEEEHNRRQEATNQPPAGQGASSREEGAGNVRPGSTEQEPTTDNNPMIPTGAQDEER